eukprot:scaffold13120_cov39-Phaeocystis_antarctica.AAC.2
MSRSSARWASSDERPAFGFFRAVVKLPPSPPVRCLACVGRFHCGVRATPGPWLLSEPVQSPRPHASHFVD